MSAQDNLSPKQFFHGTRHEFQPGELIVTPDARGAPNRFNEGNTSANRTTRSHTYFTPDYDFARKLSQANSYHDDPDGRPHVYEVEPTGKFDKDRRTHDTEAFKSKSPLRVVSEVKQYGVSGFIIRKTEVHDYDWNSASAR